MRRPVGVKWFLCRSCLSLVSSQPSYQLSPPFHPHSSMSEFFRSVQVGCSRFSRCCHLIVDLPSHPRWKLGQAINAVTGTRRLGFVLPIGSTTRLPVAWPDCYCAAVHKPPHLPTGDGGLAHLCAATAPVLADTITTEAAAPLLALQGCASMKYGAMGFSILTDLPNPAPTPYSKSFGVGSIATQSSKSAKTGASSARGWRRQKAKVGSPYSSKIKLVYPPITPALSSPGLFPVSLNPE